MALVPDRQPSVAGLHARRADTDAGFLLELEDVGEVASEVEQERELLCRFAVIANPQVLVDPAADDAVPLQRDGRVVTEPRGRQVPKIRAE